MPRVDLADSGRWSGEWWVPGESERKQGTLQYSSDDGPVLELVQGWEYRTFAEPRVGLQVQQPSKKDWPLVHGLADGMRFTLLDVTMLDGDNHTAEKPGRMAYRAKVALVGEYVNADAAAHITRVRLEIENLSQLTANSGIAANWLIDEQNRPNGTGSVSMDFVPPSEFATQDGMVRIGRWYDLPSSKATRRSFTGYLAETVHLDVFPPAPIGLDDSFELASKVRQLVSVAALDDCAIISIQTEMPLVDTELPAGHPHALNPAVLDVLIRPLTVPRPDARAVPVHDFVITASQVGPEVFVPRWLALSVSQASALRLLTAVLTDTSRDVGARVLAAVSCAEAFHRGTNPEPPMSSAEFMELRRRLTDAASDVHKDWVKAKFSENQHSLRQRLRALAKKLPDELRHALNFSERVWLEAATGARNRVAHSGSAGSMEVATLDAVANLTAAIVLLHVLLALGLDESACLNLFVENKWFRRVARDSRRHLSR